MIQIEKLPSLVLEKLFSFIPNKLELRLVCKRFKDTVDTSSQLLQKYYLNVSKIGASHSCTELRIRSLKFEHLGHQEFTWIHDYDQRDRISSMRFAVGYRVIENSAEFLQYILLNYKFVQEFYLLIYDEVLSFWNPVYYLKNMYSNWFPGPREILNDVKSSKLQHLTICSRHSINDVLSIFSDISSIKTLEICNHSPPLRFPDQVSWSLETLQFNHFQLDEDECKRILESQRSTLKIIDLYSESICNYVMTYHPDVESLSLWRSDEAVGHLVPNEKLISLKLYNVSQDTLYLEHMLSHFMYIKYLRLTNDSGSDLKPLNNILLENLTHLILNGMISNFLMTTKTPKLKNLEILSSTIENTHDFFMIPDENLENIEKLSMCDLKIDQISAILLKCTKLKHLNVGMFASIQPDHLGLIINRIIAKAPELRILGILESYLKHQKMTYEQLLSQMDNKMIVLKVYDNYKKMTNEYWECKYFGSDEAENEND